jgi:VWFA-related protein
VPATVTDSNGRFISGLRKEDFTLYEDGQPQQISHFNNERVPVSLGITLDTSGSMAGEKFVAAQGALDRFLFDLLDAQDHVFLTRFSNHPIMVHDWTTDRTAVSRALSRVIPNGGTAMYDAVAEAVPIAESGTHRKKALVIISDGNDTNSSTTVPELKQMIRESEVLVYAIGIDGSGRRYGSYQQQPAQQQPPMPRLPIPLPFPGARRPPTQPPPQPPPSYPPTSGGRTTRGRDEAVNVQALREITDDTGGRTEIIYSAQDLNPATSGIASELNQQYYLGYAAPSTKDGRWHSIRVEVRQRDAIVRARRGYVATP